MHDTANKPETLTLLGVGDELLEELDFLLEHGIGLPCPSGMTAASLLRELGLDPAQVGPEELTLDGQPLDALDAGDIAPGMVVCLGEDDADHDPEDQDTEEALLAYSVELARAAGALWLQLRGGYAEYLSPVLLRRGVLTPLPVADALLQVLPDGFWKRSGGALLRGRRFNPLTHELAMPRTKALVLLEVRAPGGDREPR